MNNQSIREQMLAKMREISTAMYDLNLLWEQADQVDTANGDLMSNEYPFIHDFGALCDSVSTWCDVVEGLFAENIVGEVIVEPKDQKHRYFINIAEGTEEMDYIYLSDGNPYVYGDKITVRDDLNRGLTVTFRVDELAEISKEEYMLLYNANCIGDDKILEYVSEYVSERHKDNPFGTSYVGELEEFKEHIQKSANEMLDELDEKGYQDRFDIVISMNGKSITAPLNADLHERLIKFIDDEIEEANQ